MKKLLDKFVDGDVFEHACGDNRVLRLIDENQDIWQLVSDEYVDCRVCAIPEYNGSNRFFSSDFQHHEKNIYYARYLKYIYKGEQKMTNKIFYKIVRENLRSGFYGSFQYKEGEFVYSPTPGTYLYVFDTLENAQARCGQDQLIYECECEGIHDGVPESAAGIAFPTGTRFAYGVKLTKRITPNYITVPGSKWYFINLYGETEVWEEMNNGRVKQVVCTKNEILTDTTYSVNAQGFAGYQVDKYNGSWYLTRDKTKLEVLPELLKNKIIQFVSPC